MAARTPRTRAAVAQAAVVLDGGSGGRGRRRPIRAPRSAPRAEVRRCDGADAGSSAPGAVQADDGRASSASRASASAGPRAGGRRRELFAAAAAAALLAPAGANSPADAEQLADAAAALGGAGGVDYSAPGPFLTGTLLTLEHTPEDLYPLCQGSLCLERLRITYPKASGAGAKRQKAPLAVLSSGFSVDAKMYSSYAQHLASWGWCVVGYDVNNNSMLSPLTDDLLAGHVREIINYVTAQPPFAGRVCAKEAEVLLVGHSRGAKVSVLESASDPRVGALVLLDPVDNTVYAPLAPGFPSANALLRHGLDGTGADIDTKETAAAAARDSTATPSMAEVGAAEAAEVGKAPSEGSATRRQRRVPIAIVGAAGGNDCAPADANYSTFYASAVAGRTGDAYLVELPKAGHLQYLDGTNLQRAACAESEEVDDEVVHAVSRALIVSWGLKHLRNSSATGGTFYSDTSGGGNGTYLPAELDGATVDVQSVVDSIGSRYGVELKSQSHNA